MDVGDMTMITTTATGTMTGMPAATSTAGTMSGMGSGSGCKISMLWNWETIGACFISRSWKITSDSMFAGSCIGVIGLAMLLEVLRRAVKEYDRYLIRHHARRNVVVNNAGADDDAGPPASGGVDVETKGRSSPVAAVSNISNASTVGNINNAGNPRRVNIEPFRPNFCQQAIRAAIHVCQFAVAYFVMLLAMYYNGYIIICIFIGSYIGAFIFQWETLVDASTSAAREGTVCCG